MTKTEIKRNLKQAKKDVFNMYLKSLKAYGQANRCEGALSLQEATEFVRKTSAAWHAVQKSGMYLYSDALATA